MNGWVNACAGVKRFDGSKANIFSKISLSCNTFLCSDSLNVCPAISSALKSLIGWILEIVTIFSYKKW